MSIDSSRLSRAANDYFCATGDLGADLTRLISVLALRIRWRLLADSRETHEGDVLRLVAATIVLADNLGYSLDDVYAKLTAKGDV